jgi:hypothetical protein
MLLLKPRGPSEISTPIENLTAPRASVNGDQWALALIGYMLFHLADEDPR